LGNISAASDSKDYLFKSPTGQWSPCDAFSCILQSLQASVVAGTNKTLATVNYSLKVKVNCVKQGSEMGDYFRRGPTFGEHGWAFFS